MVLCQVTENPFPCPLFLQEVIVTKDVTVEQVEQLTSRRGPSDPILHTAYLIPIIPRRLFDHKVF
jgi:hypothetical protein